MSEEMYMNKMWKYTWDATNDGDPWIDAGKWFATQEECYMDMLQAATSKSTWACEWRDVVDRPLEPGDDGIVHADPYSSISFKGTCYPDRIVLDPSTGKYVYTIRAERCKCTRDQYDAVIDWARKTDGFDGAIEGLFNAFLWYPNGDPSGEKAVLAGSWWDRHLDKWNSIPPGGDYCAEQAKKTGWMLESVCIDVAEEIAAKMEVFNQETRDRVEEFKRKRKFYVRLRVDICNAMIVDANDEHEAKEIARKQVVESLPKCEFPNGWYLFDAISCDRDADFVTVDDVTEVK